MDAQTARGLLAYDANSGVLTWRVSRGKAKAGSVSGSVKKDGYRSVCVFGKSFQAHRLAWLIVHGAWPRQQIDHINGDRDDNRLSNLRDVSVVGNAQNRHKANGSSGLIGVTKHKNGYQAQIGVSNKVRYIGLFRTANEARAAYLAAKQELHVEAL